MKTMLLPGHHQALIILGLRDEFIAHAGDCVVPINGRHGEPQAAARAGRPKVGSKGNGETSLARPMISITSAAASISTMSLSPNNHDGAAILPSRALQIMSMERVRRSMFFDLSCRGSPS